MRQEAGARCEKVNVARGRGQPACHVSIWAKRFVDSEAIKWLCAEFAGF
jgi:hypothetical protein